MSELKIIESAERNIRSCETCRWHLLRNDKHICNIPGHRGFDPITGKEIESKELCQTWRASMIVSTAERGSETWACAPEALWWQPKDPIQRKNFERERRIKKLKSGRLFLLCWSIFLLFIWVLFSSLQVKS